MICCLEDPITKLSTDMINDAVMLYKLIHQRYIMTKSGLQAMWEKFDNHAFGTCPRYLCHDQALLPVGPSAVPDAECLRVYCLHCQDLYRPFSAKHCKADGLPFGPTFAHFFVRTVLYANPHKAAENRKGEHDWQIYVPKIYGFRLFRQGEMNCGGIRTERPLDFK
jgi:casein kinase II subunit beta